MTEEVRSGKMTYCLPAEGRQAIGTDILPGCTPDKENHVQIRLVVVVVVVLLLVVTNFLNSILRSNFGTYYTQMTPTMFVKF